MLPGFLVIGPPRTGTTWLYQVLRTHPEIFLPDIKQLHFFDRNLSRGLDWYRAHFSGAKPNQVCGEVTPDYISSSDCICRIKEYLPRVQMIILYRDPVERAYSHFRIRDRYGIYQGKKFSEVFSADPYLIGNSLYGARINDVLEHFSACNVLILDFKAVRLDSQGAVDAVSEFLGLKQHTVSPDILRSSFAEGYPEAKIKMFDRAVYMTKRLLELSGVDANELKLGWLRKLNRRIKRLNSVGSSCGETGLSAEAEKQLEADHALFQDLIKKHNLLYWKGEKDGCPI